MVVHSDGRNQKVLVIKESASCYTTSAIWVSGLATIGHETRFGTFCMAMIHLTALKLKTTFITITAAGKRIGNEQTNAKNQN